MKDRNRIYKLMALLLVLVLLMPGASMGTDEENPDAPAAVYSDWLRLGDPQESGGDREGLSGTRDLRPLLREAVLLDAQGTPLAEGGAWPVEPHTAYLVRLRFRETPGDGSLQFDADNGPLVFPLPEGLSIGEDSLALPVRIGLDDGGSVEAACACDAAAGVLSVSWDPDSGIAEQIRAAEGAGFEVVIPAVFGDVGTLAFADHLAVSLRRAEPVTLAAEGPDYEITVTCTEDALILTGARLAAAELTASEPRYQTFLEASSRALGCGPEDLTHSRLFDLSIVSAEGAPVTPAAPVRVRIGYAVPLLFEANQRFLVAHLAESGTEFLVPAAEVDAEGRVTAFTFETDSFSPYGIASSPLTADRSAQGESSDLADFLYKIDIEGAEKNAEGKYVILEGVPYTVQMYFSEKTNGIQFDEDPEGGALVYHFPAGFTPNPTSGTVEVTGDDGDVWLHYVIDGNTMTVTFDPDSPGYSAFLTSENANFEIHATGVISREAITFSSEASGEFEFDDQREVSVQKTGDYDAELNKIKFTVLASSKGNNTNIHIGDIIEGSALRYDPASLTLTSNLSNPVQYNDDTRTGETFGLTIPAMAHGETITIEYYANVDLSGLTATGSGHYGTIEETGNTVRISSQEDTPGDDDTVSDEDFDHRISLSNIGKTASSQTVRDGKTYITWTIVLNEHANISIAGKSVTDSIDGSSRAFMRYAGSGIHVKKFEKDGTPAGTDDVQWGTDGLSGSSGGSTWTYTIPASDAGKNYKYVITYETEVDSEAFLKPTTVSNTVEDEYGSGHGAVSVDTTGEKVEAEKTVVQSTVDAAQKQAETEWKITFTVPATGLDSAVIVDSLPAFLNYTDMIWYYDAYKAGSVRVGEGDLLEGERISVDASSQDHKVTITFAKNDEEAGLTGTGQTRTIHVYLTTTASHEWLEYAETLSRARTHVNNAVVRVNEQDINVTGSVSYNTTEYDLEKAYDATYATSTDPALPIYVYKIVLTNVNDEAFGEDGCITITDDYDAGYLAFHPTYATYDGNNVNTPNGCVYGNTQNNKYGKIAKGPYVVDPSSTKGHLVFKIRKEDLPMYQSSYYPYYAVYYALQVKDADTLARIRDEALHADGLKVELGNTAISEQFGTSTIVTEYTIHALEKKKEWEADNSGTGTHDIHFLIEVNRECLNIGDEEMITLRDTLTNLSFDYTSIVVEPWLEGDILDRAGSSVIFTLHNHTYYRITYTARLIGLHDVHWNNKAVLSGYTSGVSGTSSSQSGGSGSYRTYGMNIKKYEQGNMAHGLAATFELYEARVKDAAGNEIPGYTWRRIGKFTTDGTTGLYSINTVIPDGDEEERSLRPYSYHDADGNERFDGEGAEAYGWRYRVKEITAPAGYQRTDVLYEFGISDIPSYAAPYNYLNHDTVTIVNKPIPSQVVTSIPGIKTLIGKKLQNEEFTFSLRPEDSVRELWGEGYPGGFDGSLTAKNDAEGHFSFPLSYTYEDYLNAEDKGFTDENGSVYFYYVVREELPIGAVDNIVNGVRYDQSQFLVQVKLSVNGDQLMVERKYYPYNGSI